MFGSEGYEVNLMHHRGQFYKAESKKGEINKPGYINRRALFGYKLFNNPGRITKPWLKTKNGFEEISFEQAFELISKNFLRYKQMKTPFWWSKTHQ